MIATRPRGTDEGLPAPDRPVAEPLQLDLLIREARRRQRRRQLAVSGLVIAVFSGVAVVVTTGSLASSHAPRLARPRHLPPLGAGGGSILHIDATTTEITTGHPTYTWEDDTYQETSLPYRARNIHKRGLGTRSGTEGVYGIGIGDQTYDPANNTIYDPPKPQPVPGERTATPAQEAVLFRPYMAQYVRRLRAQLASGAAQVDGRPTVDGRAAIKIKFARSHEIDYVDADGSYVPIKTIYGTPSSPGGQTITVYRAFEFLPAAGNARLLSLTAQHPSARIDRSLQDFRAADKRLYPNG